MDSNRFGTWSTNVSRRVGESYFKDGQSEELPMNAPTKYAPMPPMRQELQNFLRIPQEKSNWCWAAATDMVAEYYYRQTKEVKQCELASNLFGLSDCCKSDPSSSSGKCNQGCEVTDVSAVFETLKIEAQFRNRSLTLKELQLEIDAKRPVQVGFEWTGGGGHVVIVIGYGRDEAGDFLIVNDPLDKYQRAVVSYVSLKNAYGKGRWAWTWIGIQLNKGVPTMKPKEIPEEIPEEYLENIIEQLYTWAKREGIEIPSGTAIELGATFSTWVLGANSIKGREDFGKLATPTGRLQHQVKIGGKNVGYACSYRQSNSVSEFFRSEKIDKAIERVKNIECVKTKLEQKLPLQLLEVPAYQVDALWLFDESKRENQVLVIDAPEEFTRLERDRLLTSQEFLEALDKERVVTGIFEKIPSAGIREDQR
jgi:hypothetical protein